MTVHFLKLSSDTWRTVRLVALFVSGIGAFVAFVVYAVRDSIRTREERCATYYALAHSGRDTLQVIKDFRCELPDSPGLPRTG